MSGFITFFLHFKKSMSLKKFRPSNGNLELFYLFTTYFSALFHVIYEICVLLKVASPLSNYELLWWLLAAVASFVFCLIFFFRDKSYKYLSSSHFYLYAVLVLMLAGIGGTVKIAVFQEDRRLKLLNQPPTFIRTDTSSQSHPSGTSRRPL